MAFQSIPAADIAVDKFVTEDVMEIIKDDLDYLYSKTIFGTDPANGSFEVDSDSDGTPDSWDIELYPGGSCVLDTDSPAHGEKCLSFIHPGGSGNGGGFALSDYMLCGEVIVMVRGWHWVSAAGMKCEVILRWYTKAKVYISSTTLYSSVANPTIPIFSRWIAAPPDNARFAKLEIIGGKDDVDVAGTAYFDGFEFSTPEEWVNAADDYQAASGTFTSAANPPAETWEKVIEYVCTANGSLRTSLTLSNGYNNDFHAMIKRNDVSVGIERIITGGSTTETFSEDIVPFQTGDRLQVFAKGQGVIYQVSLTVTVNNLIIPFMGLI